jgi:purine-binding chemotaxis protein CheW
MAEYQYAIFNLGEEKYGVDILNVAGITEVINISKMPQAPSYVEGIMNLRGEVIPIINLKKRFGYDDVSFPKNARIMLISINEDKIGYIVDDTSQVIKFGDDDIDPTPTILVADDKKYLKGIGKYQNEIYILLDMQRILDEFETTKVLEAAKE